MPNGNRGALLEKCVVEAERIEEDSTYNYVGHYEAAHVWDGFGHAIGFPIAFLSAVAAFTVFTQPTLATVLTIATTLLALMMLYFRPAEQSALHYRTGGKFKTLRDRCRFYREVVLERQDLSAERITDALQDLYDEKRLISELGIPIPNYAYKRAKKKIRAGQASYDRDGVFSPAE